MRACPRTGNPHATAPSAMHHQRQRPPRLAGCAAGGSGLAGIRGRHDAAVGGFLLGCALALPRAWAFLPARACASIILRPPAKTAAPALQAFAGAGRGAAGLAGTGMGGPGRSGAGPGGARPFFRARRAAGRAAVWLRHGVGARVGARALVLLAGGNLRALVTLLCLEPGGAGHADRCWRRCANGCRAGARSRWRMPRWRSSCRLAACRPRPPLALATGPPALALAGLRPVATGAAPERSATVGRHGHWRPGGRRMVDHGPGGRGSVRSRHHHITELHRPRGRRPAVPATGRGSGRQRRPAIVAGTLAGAFAAALLTRSLRWEGFEQPARLAASALGGLLMGLAACWPWLPIGQGLSGLSTLAFASLPAAIGIAGGASITLRLQAPIPVDPSNRTAMKRRNFLISPALAWARPPRPRWRWRRWPSSAAGAHPAAPGKGPHRHLRWWLGWPDGGALPARADSECRRGGAGRNPSFWSAR